MDEIDLCFNSYCSYCCFNASNYLQSFDGPIQQNLMRIQNYENLNKKYEYGGLASRIVH